MLRTMLVFMIIAITATMVIVALIRKFVLAPIYHATTIGNSDDSRPLTTNSVAQSTCTYFVCVFVRVSGGLYYFDYSPLVVVVLGSRLCRRTRRFEWNVYAMFFVRACVSPFSSPFSLRVGCVDVCCCCLSFLTAQRTRFTIYNIARVPDDNRSGSTSQVTTTEPTDSSTPCEVAAAPAPGAVAETTTLRRKVCFSNANSVMGDHVDVVVVNSGEPAAEHTAEDRPNFLVGESGETVQEAHEADDEFPTKLQNGKYSSEDVAEKRKRLR